MDSRYEDMREDLATAENEWREVGRVATSVADAIEQASDALDAELTKEALEEALSNWRLIDFSGPESEVKRLAELDRLESAIDQMLNEAQSGDEDDDPDGVPGDSDAITLADLNEDETRSLIAICIKDSVPVTGYSLWRRKADEHAFADNGMSMTFDLTDFRNVASS